ncbi:cytochrome b/b6 domain-containing protein [Phenylobacterium sp.]|uniref:cytochrome b/b6 domain-containing protein n=1 Tax=Phenylobacterium sp. TaxID=1871053 RepID=UPI0025E1435A|nr:cytochrome b/b6 domain-containing protein [Phenylobacterium sp.]
MTTRRTGRWDPLVRLTHWGVAAGIVANGLVTEEGSSAHQAVGYAVAALLLLRWLWGFVGPREARFASFPPSLGRAAGHVRDIAAGRPTTHRSHNPLGALMVYALWGTMAVVIATGIGMTGLPKGWPGAPASPAEATTPSRSDGLASPPARLQEEEEAGEAREHEAGERSEGGERADADEGEEREEGPMGEIHEVAANLLFVLAALHLLGVAFETRRSGRQVVTAMVTGGRRPSDGA